jgi:hypothetical protein
MKKILNKIKFVSLLLYVYAILAFNLACTGSHKSEGPPPGVYRAPGYVKKDYKEILVYAKLENTAYRQKLENAMVDELNKRGYHALPAYKNFEVSYKYDSVQFMNKINELKIDAVIAFDYLGQRTTVEESYRYNGGMYNYFVTGSAPYDLETTSKQTGYMRMDFYNLDARTSQYNAIVPIKLFNGLDEAVRGLTADSYSRLKSDRII